MASTAERLGYPADARLLIINGDDIGMCHSANVATVAGLKEGILTSSSLMVPCSWANEAVQMSAGLDVGVHFTITAEWRTYRWGPMTAAARDPKNGLVDSEGYFWSQGGPVVEQGNPEVARGEAVAQLEWALARGVDVSSLDDHMAVYASSPALLRIFLDLAKEYRLPARLGLGFWFDPALRAELSAMVDAARPTVLGPDNLAGLALQDPEKLEGQMIESIRKLKPGVTEYILHASAPGDELNAIAPDAAARVEAFRLVTTSEPVRKAIEAEGIKLIGYRELREAQRAGA
jgi:hypothetical protein